MSDQSAVQRTLTDLDKAKAVEITAQAVVNRAQAVEQKVCAQIEAVSIAYESIVAQERDAIPSNDAAIRHLSAERSFLESKRRALEGALTRAQSEHAKARTDLDLARAKLAHATTVHDTATEKSEQADRDHQEAQLVAAGDPFALRRKAERERADAIRDEHLRIVRASGTFAPGGGPCEVAIDAEKARTREPREASPALAPNDHGWGSSSFERGRYSSPVGSREQTQPQQEGMAPYNTQDPLRNE